MTPKLKITVSIVIQWFSSFLNINQHSPHFWHSSSFFQWLRLLNISKQLVKGMCNESYLGDGFLRKTKCCIYLSFDGSACLSSVKETWIASFQIWRQSILQPRWKLIVSLKTLHNHTWSQWQHSGSRRFAGQPRALLYSNSVIFKEHVFSDQPARVQHLLAYKLLNSQEKIHIKERFP